MREKLSQILPDCDFGVLSHGFTEYMRDYALVVQVPGSSEGSGTYECLFTHCVVAMAETRVHDEVWPRSWSDDFIDYARWQSAGEPDGFVWGAKWSLAFPGLNVVQGSELAAAWSERLKQLMHEVVIETEAFSLRLVAHDVRFTKLSDETSPINAALIPLSPGDA